MRTFVTILSALTVAILITACQKEEKKSEPSPAPTAGTEATASPTMGPSATPGPEAKPKVTQYDFKLADWGMTMAEVKATEPKKPAYENADSLTYNSAIAGMFAYSTYQFKDGKLFRAGFIFAEKRPTDEKYLDDYEKIKKELIKVNGAPVIDGVKQLNPDAEVTSENRGAAVCRGDFIYGAQWNIPRTVIRLVLQGKDAKCILSAVYTSASEDQAAASPDGAGLPE